MRIKEIRLKEHTSPLSSSGTGYSEPDIFSFTLEDGSERNIVIDIWYLPIYLIKTRFYNDVYRQIGGEPDNMLEAFNMYVKIIANHSCPWSEEEILKTYDQI